MNQQKKPMAADKKTNAAYNDKTTEGTQAMTKETKEMTEFRRAEGPRRARSPADVVFQCAESRGMRQWLLTFIGQ